MGRASIKEFRELLISYNITPLVGVLQKKETLYLFTDVLFGYECLQIVTKTSVFVIKKSYFNAKHSFSLLYCLIIFQGFWKFVLMFTKITMTWQWLWSLEKNDWQSKLWWNETSRNHGADDDNADDESRVVLANPSYSAVRLKLWPQWRNFRTTFGRFIMMIIIIMILRV